MILHQTLLLGKDSSCPVDSKNGQTFENPIIGIGDIGLNGREHEIKKILKDGSILTLLKSFIYRGGQNLNLITNKTIWEVKMLLL